MSKIDERFIVSLQGKQFVTYEGLLDLAHQEGLIGIETELIQIPTKDNDYLAIVQAIATTKDKKFMGIGDCDNSSANRMIAPHKIRMAETRAKARALRDLTNVGMTAIEELGEDAEEPKITQQATRQTTKSQSKKADENKQAIVDNSLASDAQINYINKLIEGKGYGQDAMINYIKSTYNKSDLKALSKKEAGEVINMLNGLRGN